ncbi:MAG: hypothetical protein HY399_05460 [Elusimicrobia bacterium]|nr:hypothetical protein [Elusimicrobiota bacterium]
MSREIRRKAFHGLSLLYLWFYLRQGREAFLLPMGIWLLIVIFFELGRLWSPKLNRWVMAPFESFRRREEKTKPSAILYTALGCWLTVLFFGQGREVILASFLFLALGDAAAALIGQVWNWGSFTIRGCKKSLSGSLACFVVCFFVAWFLGLPPKALWGGSLAATILELLPLPLNDNFWMPLGSALVLSALI